MAEIFPDSVSHAQTSGVITEFTPYYPIIADASILQSAALVDELLRTDITVADTSHAQSGFPFILGTTLIYPETPIPHYIYVLEDTFNTLISEFDSGAEQRRRLRRFPKRTFNLIYRKLSLTDRNTIKNFYRQRYGMSDSFYFYDLTKRNWTDEYVGRGDGSRTAFDLHSQTTDDDSTLKIYVDGIQKIKTTHYTVTTGGGSADSDQIEFTGGNIPTAGQLITADFNGYLRIKARFGEDSIREEMEIKDLFDMSTILYEVQW